MAAPLAVVATAGVVSLGVAAADVHPVGLAGPHVSSTVVGDTAASGGDLAGAAVRRPTLSRSSSSRKAADTRTAAPSPPKPPVSTAPAEPTALERLLAPIATRKAIANADTKLWTTEALNLWTEPGENATRTGVVDAGEGVFVTGRDMYGRVEIVWEKTETRWVTAGYLSDEKPTTTTFGGDCTNGTSVSSGVSPNVVKVHQAVCAAFPDITVYGTFRGDGEHAQGLAVDIMVSGSAGQAVADFVREHYAELGVNYLIYAQQIWSVDRASEGWRGMEDRGSSTANHYDHVHVTTY